MPAIHSKTTSKIGVVEECSKAKKRIQNTSNNDRAITTTRRKEFIPELDLKVFSPRPTAKTQKIQKPKYRTQKIPTSAKTATKKAKSRQVDLENSHVTLDPMDSLEKTKNSIIENSISQISCYFTPRQDILGYDFENFDLNHLPESFNECELDDFIRTQYPDFEDTSKYDFDVPLVFKDMSLPSARSTYSEKRSNMLHNFKNLLNLEEKAENKLLNKKELGILRNIIKEDERHQKFHKEDFEILKEILKGQLKQIQEQERVIKIALGKIQSRDDPKKVDQAEQPFEKELANLNFCRSASAKCNSGRQEVDVIFKNVPSLEKEIQILRSLGVKLERTLTASSKKTTARPLPIHKTFSHAVNYTLSIASSRVFCLGIKLNVGLATEYKISHQTINELKLERDFYINGDENNFTLLQTNFDKLRHNPEMLLRKLKPSNKDRKLKFNFIEHDPLFFNYFLSKICSRTETCGLYIPENAYVHCLNDVMKNCTPMSGAGDCVDFSLKNEGTTMLSIEQPSFNLKKNSTTSCERRKVRLSKTPMPDKEFVSKNNLVKTCLLGVVQFTIILTLLGVLTAVFYPEINCS